MGKTKKRKSKIRATRKKRTVSKKNNTVKKRARRTWSKDYDFKPKYINLKGKRIMDNPADYDLEVKK